MTITGFHQFADILQQYPFLTTLAALLVTLSVAWAFRRFIKTHSEFFGFGLIVLAAGALATLSYPGDWLMLLLVFSASSLLPTILILARRVDTPWWVYVGFVNSALAFWFAISILNTDTALWINLLVTTMIFLLSLATTWTLKDTVDTWTELYRRLHEND